MLSRVALADIAGYQSWLSPYKGFRCTYAVAHGRPGYSGFAKQAITEKSALNAWTHIRGRFRACKTAALAFADQTPAEDAYAARKKRRYCVRWSMAEAACASCSSISLCSAGPVTSGEAATGTTSSCAQTPDACDISPSCDCGGCGW